MIEQSDIRERDFLKAHAKMEVDIINNQYKNRTLSDAEMRAFEFAIETIAQLESRQAQDTWWRVSNKRDELSQRYRLPD
jgi:thymidine phosphorylase